MDLSRQSAAKPPSSSHGRIDSVTETTTARAAEADALASAGRSEREVRALEGRRDADRAALEAVRRRIVAEELAAEQARRRAEADAEAEAVAAQRAHEERMLELAARSRVEAEERALAEARRQEFAAAELANNALARARREQAAEQAARERLASEGRALDLAQERIRLEQAAEAAALAAIAAATDANVLAQRREIEEARARYAQHMREEAERELAALPKTRRDGAEPVPRHGKTTASPPHVPATRPAPGRISIRTLVAVVVGLAFGAGIGTLMASRLLGGDEGAKDDARPASVFGPRLDTNLGGQGMVSQHKGRPDLKN